MKNFFTKHKWIITLLIIFAVPFIVVYSARFFGYESYGRLFNIIIIATIVPFSFLWMGLNPKYIISDKLPKGTAQIIFKIISGLVGIFMVWFFTIPLFKDTVQFFYNYPETINGFIEDVQRTAYDLPFKSQTIYLNKEIKSYKLIYSINYLYQGDVVELKYLPRTRMVLEAKIIENE